MAALKAPTCQAADLVGRGRRARRRMPSITSRDAMWMSIGVTDALQLVGHRRDACFLRRAHNLRALRARRRHLLAVGRGERRRRAAGGGPLAPRLATSTSCPLDHRGRRRRCSAATLPPRRPDRTLPPPASRGRRSAAGLAAAAAALAAQRRRSVSPAAFGSSAAAEPRAGPTSASAPCGRALGARPPSRAARSLLLPTSSSCLRSLDASAAASAVAAPAAAVADSHGGVEPHARHARHSAAVRRRPIHLGARFRLCQRCRRVSTTRTRGRRLGHRPPPPPPPPFHSAAADHGQSRSDTGDATGRPTHRRRLRRGALAGGGRFASAPSLSLSLSLELLRERHLWRRRCSCSDELRLRSFKRGGLLPARLFFERSDFFSYSNIA